MRPIDEKGKRYGRLLVQAAGTPTPQGKSRWWCLCDCGNRSLVVGSDLRSGNTTSCGCRKEELRAARFTTHGFRASGRTHPSYPSWANMLQRCTNPNDPAYRHYGGRGITVCERWQSFENFLADMGERPEGLTLDRTDNEGNYEPGNCKWATRAQQSANRRSPDTWDL